MKKALIFVIIRVYIYKTCKIEVKIMRKRMKAETKRKIAGVIAGILAAALIFSSIGVIFIR